MPRDGKDRGSLYDSHGGKKGGKHGYEDYGKGSALTLLFVRK